MREHVTSRQSGTWCEHRHSFSRARPSVGAATFSSIGGTVENETRHHFRPRRRPRRSGQVLLSPGLGCITRESRASKISCAAPAAGLPDRPKIINSRVTHLDGRRRRRFDTASPALAAGQARELAKLTGDARRSASGARVPTYTSRPRRSPCLPARARAVSR